MVAISKGKEALIRNQFSVHSITNTYMFRGVGYIMQHTPVWLRTYILELVMRVYMTHKIVPWLWARYVEAHSVHGVGCGVFMHKRS